MHSKSAICGLGSLLLAVAASTSASAQGSAAPENWATGGSTDLENRIARSEALKQIERLQYALGYYQDRFLYDEVASLFSRTGPSVQWGDRVWEGRDAVRAFWLDYWKEVFAEGNSGPVAGRMLDLPQWQGVITVADDLQSAQARFRTIGRYAVHREREFWISGFFSNRYVQEDGVWKISALRFCPNWSSRYTEGWQDIDQANALEWLPTPPESARETRNATETELCPEPYPGTRDMRFHFDTPDNSADSKSSKGAEQ